MNRRSVPRSPCPRVSLSPCPSASNKATAHEICLLHDSCPRLPTPRRGVVLIAALVCLALIAALGGTLLRWAAMEHTLLRSQAQASQARWLAEAGAQRAAAQLARDANYKGETWNIAAADLPSGEAARVGIAVSAADGEGGRRSIEVDAEYPLDSGVASRAHKEMVFQLPAEEAS